MTTFRYSWRRCVPGDDTAFIGTDGLLKFGGVVLLKSGSDEGQWKWDLSGLHFPGYTVRGHMAGSPREVAAFLEDEYDRQLPQSDGLEMRHEAEIAHYEERGIALPLPVQWRKAVFVDGMPNAEADALFRPGYEPPSTSTTHSRRSRK